MDTGDTLLAWLEDNAATSDARLRRLSFSRDMPGPRVSIQNAEDDAHLTQAYVDYLKSLRRVADAAFELSDSADLVDKNHNEFYERLDAALAAIGRKPSNMLRSDGDG
jgi:hypothetical protein